MAIIRATNKIGLTTGKLYRGITIFCQGESSFMIYGADGKAYSFISWEEATAFVDTWYAMQYAVVTQS